MTNIEYQLEVQTQAKEDHSNLSNNQIVYQEMSIGKSYQIITVWILDRD